MENEGESGGYLAPAHPAWTKALGSLAGQMSFGLVRSSFQGGFERIERSVGDT